MKAEGRKRAGRRGPRPHRLAAVILPASKNFPSQGQRTNFDRHPLHDALFERYQVEVPVLRCPGSGEMLVRLSAALYNEREDYERLADALAGFPVSLSVAW